MSACIRSVGVRVCYVRTGECRCGVYEGVGECGCVCLCMGGGICGQLQFQVHQMTPLTWFTQLQARFKTQDRASIAWPSSVTAGRRTSRDGRSKYRHYHDNAFW